MNNGEKLFMCGSWYIYNSNVLLWANQKEYQLYGRRIIYVRSEVSCMY